MTDSYEPRDHEGGALRGVSVLDLTIARAGPTCVRQLADMGADVIQVGNPRGGTLRGSDGHNLHRNKRSILIDLKMSVSHGRGRETVRRPISMRSFSELSRISNRNGKRTVLRWIFSWPSRRWRCPRTRGN